MSRPLRQFVPLKRVKLTPQPNLPRRNTFGIDPNFPRKMNPKTFIQPNYSHTKHLQNFMDGKEKHFKKNFWVQRPQINGKFRDSHGNIQLRNKDNLLFIDTHQVSVNPQGPSGVHHTRRRRVGPMGDNLFRSRAHSHQPPMYEAIQSNGNSKSLPHHPKRFLEDYPIPIPLAALRNTLQPPFRNGHSPNPSNLRNNLNYIFEQQNRIVISSHRKSLTTVQVRPDPVSTANPVPISRLTQRPLLSPHSLTVPRNRQYFNPSRISSQQTRFNPPLHPHLNLSSRTILNREQYPGRNNNRFEDRMKDLIGKIFHANCAIRDSDAFRRCVVGFADLESRNLAKYGR